MKKHLLFLFLLFSVFLYSQSDCGQSVSICGNGDIYYDPNGGGTVEISGNNSCGDSEQNSIWLKITVETAGTLGFTLTPDLPQDYDFYLFGPSPDCANKGYAIRCSYYAGVGSTGMNASSTDVAESAYNSVPAGSGVADGFVKQINVLPGETYFLCINRYTSSSYGGFNLTWNGTATLDDPFEDAEYSFQAPEPVYVCNNPFDFSTLTNGILNGNTGFVVTYHQNGNDVTTGNNPITTPINVSTKDYYYRVKSTDPGNSCFQSGIIQMNYVPLILTTTQVTLKQCPDDNGQAIFNLSTAVFTSTAGVTKKYYPTQEDMDNGTNEITNFTNYLSGPGEIFVKLKNQYDCTKTAKIILSLYQRPTVNDDAVETCEVGGVGIFDLSQANVTSSTGITKKYFTDYDSAMNNTVANQITNFTAYSSTGGDVYVRVENSDGCFRVAKITLLFKEKPQVNDVPLSVCSSETTANFNLSSAVITNETGVTKKYYPTYDDAYNQVAANEITNPAAYPSSGGMVYVRVMRSNQCYDIAEITLSVIIKPVVQNETLWECQTTDTGTFNLTSAVITGESGVTLHYFPSQNDLELGTNEILNITNYQSSGGEIYVKVQKSGTDCYSIAIITLVFFEKPVVSDDTLEECETTTVVLFNLSEAETTLESGVTKEYYTSYNAAQNQIAAERILNFTAYPSSGGAVYVRIMRDNQCYDIAEITLTLNALPNTQDVTIMSCEVSGTGVYDLSSANVTSSPGVTKKYYPSLTDLNNETNEILNYTAFTGVEGTQIYVKIANTKCSDYAVITLAYYNTPQVTDRELKECRVSSTVYFDLSEANTTPETGVTKKYYPSIPDLNAGTNEITNFTQYPSNGGNVFVKISNIHQCYDVAKIELIVMELPVVNDTQLQECRIGGVAVFDLSEANITSEPGITKKYYPSINDLNSGTNEITDFTNYISNGQIVYVLVENGNTCTNIAEITLKVNPFPQFTMNNFIGEFCDVNLDGKIPVDFSLVKLQILSNSTDFNVKFYLNENDALAGNNNTLPLNWQYSQDTSVYVRVESLEDCVPQFKTLEFKVSPRYPLSIDETEKICDDDTDGIKEINLDDYKDLFTTDSNALFTYYATYEDAQNEVNPIPALQTITGNKDFYFRVESAEKCANIGVLHIIFSAPKLSETLHDETICEFDTVTLDAGPGFDSYLWSTGETKQSIEAMVGEYSVILTYNGCPISQSVTVFKSEDPVLEGVEIVGTTVTIHASGGLPPLWYSIDGITYQTSNVFENVRKGIYTAYVKSTGICPSITAEFSVVEINNAITPNKDGFNDVMDYSVLKTKNNVKLQVYNREGALVFSGAASNNYVWDGTSAGRPVQSGTYWYIITYNEPYQNTPVLLKGWVLLKNRD